MTLPPLAKTPATHIVIGAGDGSQIDLASTGRHILIEPEPEAAAALAQRFDKQDNITVMPVAVSSEDGKAPFHVVNFRALSSLRAPDGLKDIMPGLKVLAKPTVTVVSVPTLLSRIGDIAPPLHLVLDAPGATLDILKGWKTAKALDMIDCLDLHCTQDSMYKGDADLEQIETWLATEGFQVSEADKSDPDWPILRFSINTTARALARLQRKLPDIEARAKEAEAALAQSKATVETRQKRIAEVEEQLAQQKDARANAEKTAQDKSAALAEMTKAKVAQEAALTQSKATAETRQKRIAEVEEQLAQQKDARANAEKTAQDKSAALAEMTKAKVAQEAALAQSKATLETRQKRIAEVEGQLTQLVKQKEDLKKQAEDRSSQLLAADQRITDLQRKLTLAREDLHRAEGQVGLIRDLLLTGDTL